MRPVKITCRRLVMHLNGLEPEGDFIRWWVWAVVCVWDYIFVFCVCGGFKPGREACLRSFRPPCLPATEGGGGWYMEKTDCGREELRTIQKRNNSVLFLMECLHLNSAIEENTAKFNEVPEKKWKKHDSDVQKWSHMLCSAPTCCVTVRFHYSLEGSDNKGLQTVGQTSADSLLTPSVSPVSRSMQAPHLSHDGARWGQRSEPVTQRSLDWLPGLSFTTVLGFMKHVSICPWNTFELAADYQETEKNKHYLTEWTHQKGWFRFVNGSAGVIPPLWVLLM